MTKDTEQLALVLGGTGKTGKRVVERLRKAGSAVRVGSRSAEPPFEWEDQSTWRPALENVQSVYVNFYSDLAFPGAADSVRTFTKVAAEAGVRRLVLLSGRNEEGAQLGEKAVQESGLEWTIVRASWFAQNFSESFLLEPVIAGELAFPAGDVAEPFIDIDDIADIAAAALLEGKHVGQVYEVTGPRLMTFAEVAAELSQATGREIRYIPVTAEEYRSSLLDHGVPEEFVTPLIDLITTVLDGRNASLTDGVQRALGRPPRDFRDYARETAASGVWQVR